MRQDELKMLVEKARKRDEHALATLCEHYYPKVLKYMYYRMGPNEAEDLAGEVFAKIMRSINKQRGRFEPWLYRVARNVVIDRARYRGARPETGWNNEMMEQVSNGSDTHADAARHMDLLWALSQLTEDQREILTLKFIQGLTNSEIGESTGRKPEAIRALQFRALSALHDLMRREESPNATRP